MRSFLLSLIDIDVRSLMVATIWTNFVALCVPLAFYLIRVKRDNGLLIFPFFTLSKLCQIFGFALILARPMIPELFSVYLANALLLIAFGLESHASVQMASPEKTANIHSLAAAVLIAILIFTSGEAVFHDPALRIVAIGFAIIIILLPPGINLLLTRKNTPFGTVLGLFILAFVVMQVPRVINALYNRSMSLLTNHLIESMNMLSLLLLDIVSASLLFLIFMDSLREDAKEKSEEQRLAAAAARKSSRLKSTFLANVSHEIRTPMNGIVGFTELALTEPGLPRKAAQHLKKSLQSSQTLLQLVNDVLDVTLLESNCVELEKAPFTLHDVFSACAAIASPPAQEKNLTLYVYAEPFMRGTLVGDSKRLRQILTNLLSNAVKFTNFGMIKLTAHVDEYRQDSVGITFEVKDSGIGMSREEVSGILDSVIRADESDTRNYSGAGMGLAISRGLIELMGGTLDVQSSPGLGSKFSFTLAFPVAPSEENIAVPANAAPSGDPDGNAWELVPSFSGLALVLEDNVLNQKVIAEHLRQVGVRYIIVSNGRDGLEQVKAQAAKGEPFDLIFMDINMPILGGIETAQALQAMHCQTPIIALTANVMSNDPKLYARHGMNDFLAKPFQARDLWAVLAKYLPKADRANTAPAARTLNREAGLGNADGDGDLYGRRLGNFAQNQGDAVAKIIQAIHDGDAESARRRVRALRGLARNIGAERLSRVASLAEEALEKEAGPGLGKHIEKMDGELRALLRVLEEGDPSRPDEDDDAEDEP